MPLDDLAADYDVDDILPAIRAGLSVDGKLYAAPFYGECSFIMYRTDLFEKAGLTMPDEPDLGLHRRGRAQDHRPRRRHQRHLPARQGRLGREHGVPRPRWRTPSARRWFDEDWQPQFDQPEWKAALQLLRST